MIIRSSGHDYIIIRQHDHGLLAGELAANWGNDRFLFPEHQLILAAALHDVSWIESDIHLRWNHTENVPYDFTTFPLDERLHLYERGLNKTEQLTPYGGLLASMHYCSFLDHSDAPHNVSQFLQNERARQKRLRQRFAQEPVERDLRHLQTWDQLSLYVCMNRPGAQKNEEHPWFRNGINAMTHTGESVTIRTRWLNEQTITLDPFPFTDSWSASLPYSIVSQSPDSDDPKPNNLYHQDICFRPS